MPLGIFVIALLFVNVSFTAVLIAGHPTQEIKLACIWASVSLTVFILVVVTVLLWFKPAYGIHISNARVEIIIDVTSELIDQVWRDFISEGATVTIMEQPDEKYRVEAAFGT
jgi:hypothetical protein